MSAPCTDARSERPTPHDETMARRPMRRRLRNGAGRTRETAKRGVWLGGGGFGRRGVDRFHRRCAVRGCGRRFGAQPGCARGRTTPQRRRCRPAFTHPTGYFTRASISGVNIMRGLASCVTCEPVAQGYVFGMLVVARGGDTDCNV